MTVGVLTAHAPASLVLTENDAQSLLEEVQCYAQQVIDMARLEADKPRAAVNVTRLRQMAEELGEVVDLFRPGSALR